jgi:hypothetical protein
VAKIAVGRDDLAVALGISEPVAFLAIAFRRLFGHAVSSDTLILRQPATSVALAHQHRRSGKLIAEKIGISHQLAHSASGVAAVGAYHRINEIDLGRLGNPLFADIEAQLFGR